MHLITFDSCVLKFSFVRLLQRYQNVKMELEAQQNLERIRMEKLVQSGALMGSKKKNKSSTNATRSVSSAGASLGPEN